MNMGPPSDKEFYNRVGLVSYSHKLSPTPLLCPDLIFATLHVQSQCIALDKHFMMQLWLIYAQIHTHIHTQGEVGALAGGLVDRVRGTMHEVVETAAAALGDPCKLRFELAAREAPGLKSARRKMV